MDGSSCDHFYMGCMLARHSSRLLGIHRRDCKTETFWVITTCRMYYTLFFSLVTITGFKVDVFPHTWGKVMDFPLAIFTPNGLVNTFLTSTITIKMTYAIEVKTRFANPYTLTTGYKLHSFIHATCQELVAINQILNRKYPMLTHGQLSEDPLRE